jgi:hypothetical protein
VYEVSGLGYSEKVCLTFYPKGDSQDNSVGIATRLRPGRSGFNSRQGLRIFLFTTTSRPALGPIQLPIQCVTGVFFPRVKRQGRKADHSPPSSIEVKSYLNLYFHSPSKSSWCGA